MTIEPTVRSSARSSKGRLFECQRSLTRMTSTVKVEGLRREIVNRDESAWGDTKPKSSNRAKNRLVDGSARGAERRVQAPTSRLLDGARTRERPAVLGHEWYAGNNMALGDKSRPDGRAGSSKGRSWPLTIRADRMVEWGRRRVVSPMLTMPDDFDRPREWEGKAR